MVTLAPFPYAGGKSRVADIIWAGLGDVDHYLEPFCGSCAAFLSRPVTHRGKTTILNDSDGHLVNFWRSAKRFPAEVAREADTLRAESELAARSRFCKAARESVNELVRADVEWCDPILAGRWLYVMTLAIGGVSAGLGGNPCAMAMPPGGIGYKWMLQGGLAEWMQALAKRLEGPDVLIRGGDWARSLSLARAANGIIGVLLDPPYATGSGSVYAEKHSGDLSAEARIWAVEHGEKPNYRIVLCGYDGEHELKGWRLVEWTGAAMGFGGSARERKATRPERLWLSPHCLREAEQGSLF